MDYWIVGKKGEATTVVATFCAEDAMAEAKELARQGAEEIKIRDQNRQDLSLDDLERSIAAGLA
jgi:hypothetical protein